MGLVVALEHGHIVVKAEEHGLLLLRTAELAQLGPVSEGGEEGPAVLGGDELKLDGSLLLHNGLAVLLGLGGRRDHGGRQKNGVVEHQLQHPALVLGGVLLVQGGKGRYQLGIFNGFLHIRHENGLLYRDLEWTELGAGREGTCLPRDSGLYSS